MSRTESQARPVPGIATIGVAASQLPHLHRSGSERDLCNSICRHPPQQQQQHITPAQRHACRTTPGRVLQSEGAAATTTEEQSRPVLAGAGTYREEGVPIDEVHHILERVAFKHLGADQARRHRRVLRVLPLHLCSPSSVSMKASLDLWVRTLSSEQPWPQSTSLPDQRLRA